MTISIRLDVHFGTCRMSSTGLCTEKNICPERRLQPCELYTHWKNIVSFRINVFKVDLTTYLFTYSYTKNGGFAAIYKFSAHTVYGLAWMKLYEPAWWGGMEHLVSRCMPYSTENRLFISAIAHQTRADDLSYMEVRGERRRDLVERRVPVCAQSIFDQRPGIQALSSDITRRAGVRHWQNDI